MRKSGVYIPQSLLTADPSAGLFLHQILGFDLYDIGGKCLGTITGFGSNGAQDLLKVQGEAGPEVLIPFVQAFLVNIDFDKRQVKMDLPEGLF